MRSPEFLELSGWKCEVCASIEKEDRGVKRKEPDISNDEDDTVAYDNEEPETIAPKNKILNKTSSDWIKRRSEVKHNPYIKGSSPGSKFWILVGGIATISSVNLCSLAYMLKVILCTDYRPKKSTVDDFKILQTVCPNLLQIYSDNINKLYRGNIPNFYVELNNSKLLAFLEEIWPVIDPYILGEYRLTDEFKKASVKFRHCN